MACLGERGGAVSRVGGGQLRLNEGPTFQLQLLCEWHRVPAMARTSFHRMVNEFQDVMSV